MKFIVLDTCIVLHLLRGKESSKKCKTLLTQYDANASIVISVVTKAELESLKIQLKWGNEKSKNLDKFLENVACIDISSSDKTQMEIYAKIDAYSKGKGTDSKGKLLKGSAKTIGKNDLWIVATAAALAVPLMTADGDFDHLNSTFIRLIKLN